MATALRQGSLVSGLLILLLAAVPRNASAAPPWVDRSMTPLSGQWDFDLGLGAGHAPYDSSAGMNLEMGVGLTDRVELGLRTGLRFGNDQDRSVEADTYGRLFDRQYFDGGSSVLANPELRVRWAFLRSSIVEMGLEGRFIVPVENNTTAGLEPGLPIALHLGESVRIDTGVWLPIVTGGRPEQQNTYVGISVPVDLWIQATPRLWLGPMTGVQAVDLGNNPGNQQTSWVSMGFGLGYQIAHNLDFKTMFLFPELSSDSRYWGLGAGVQIRIE